jgi:hypothetical protein
MPLLKFEDWIPPWKSDDEFDAARAAKLIYDLHVDKDALQGRVAAVEGEKKELEGKVREFETKDLSEVDRLKRELEETKNSKPTSDPLDVARLRLALEHGLTENQAKRLVGSTPEELAADAVAYKEEHGLGKEQGSETGERPPSNRPAGQFKTGSTSEGDVPDELDPAKLQAQLPPRR